MAAAHLNLPYRFCLLFVVFLTSAIEANPVSLPFFEGFNIPTNDAITTYPNLTFDDGGSGLAPSYVVNPNGVLQVGDGGYPYYPAFGVTPDPFPTGEIIIKVDMGWDGSINNPPNGAGFGGTGLRLGTKLEIGGATGSLNNIGFHPGYTSPRGALRVEGPGGFPITDMGFVPQPGVLNHMEIDSFPDGRFSVKVVDGTNPANVFTTHFTSPGAYGGEIALLAWSGGVGLYDNFSISIAGAPLLGDYDNDGFVDAGDYVLWRKGGQLQNESETIGSNTPEDYTYWRAHFGPAAGSGSSFSSAIPEPSSLLISLVGAVAISAGQRRRSF
jgi:hypothetical protein